MHDPAPTIAEFITSLTEMLMKRVGTSRLTATKSFGLLTINLGNHHFSGSNEAEVWDNVLKHLLVFNHKWTPKEIEEAGAILEKKSREELDFLVEEAAKAGLTEEGVIKMQWRVMRKEAIIKALAKFKDLRGHRLLDAIRQEIDAEVTEEEVLFAELERRAVS